MTLDETGYLHCAYLGTDPSMMVTPAPEARDINYDVSVSVFYRTVSSLVKELTVGCKICLTCIELGLDGERVGFFNYS